LNKPRLKSWPEPWPRPISSLVLSRDLYDVDRTYQRAPGVWTKSMEQYLIDSILRGYCVPPIIVHKKNKKQFIIDGQQRWNAIMKFAGSTLELSKKYSEDIIKENNGGIKYEELSEKWRDRFNTYPLVIYSIEDYDDEEIRSTFLRLQESKPLTPGEKLNAYPGDIVLAMRELGKHKFFHKSLYLRIQRYKNYKLAATFLFLEKEGIKSINPPYLYEFFRNNKNLIKSSDEYKKVNRTLNYLSKAFNSTTPELRTEAWVVSTYLLASSLLDHYAVGEIHKDLKEFLIDFYSMVNDAKAGSDKELLDFREAVTSGTNNEDNIKLRHEIMLKRFLDVYNPPLLDENRLFSHEQKLKIFRRDEERCKLCGRKLEFGSENTHFHHKAMHSAGGPTTVDNGLLVCKNCHYSKLHGKKTNKTTT